MANKLINEQSPYLLQHAHNPVDWYPWCDEAFEKAKATITANKPLLDTIAKRLIDVETIERPEFEALLVAHGITPKKKVDIEV